MTTIKPKPRPQLWEQNEMLRLLAALAGTRYQEATDHEQAAMRDWLRGLLNRGPVQVLFVKSDNTERLMRCTLNLAAITTVAAPTDPDKKPRARQTPPNPHVIHVWDLDAQAWRSFRMDRVKSITVSVDLT